jgi:hypothetical protein
MEGELPFRKAQNPPPQAISRLEKTWFFELAMPPRGIFAAACGILLDRTPRFSECRFGEMPPIATPHAAQVWSMGPLARQAGHGVNPLSGPCHRPT